MTREPTTRQKPRHGTTSEPMLPALKDLEAYTFAVEDDDYAVFVFPLREPPVPPGLTPAEQRVVRGVIAGLSNQAIASDGGTSVRTVANQLRAVYRKCRVSGRGELIALCARAQEGETGSHGRR